MLTISRPFILFNICFFIFIFFQLLPGNCSHANQVTTITDSDKSNKSNQQNSKSKKITQKKKFLQKVLTLEDIINQALKSNRNLADSIDSLEGAHISLINAEAEFELKILPNARTGFTGSSTAGPEGSHRLGLSLNKKFKSGTQVNLRPGIEKSTDLYHTEVDTQLNQPLLRGTNREFNLSSIHSAEFDNRTAKRNLYLTSVRTIISAVTSSYDVIRQRELLRLNEESANRLKGHAEAARAKEKIGLASQIDAYRAEIQKKQAEDNLATVREAYHDSLDNLKFLLALPLDRDISIEAPLEYSLVSITEQDAIATGMKNRVELRQAADNLRDSKRQSRIARHNTLPDLDLVVNYSRFANDESFSGSTSFDEDEWGINLVTSTDLYRTVEKNTYQKSLLTIRSARRAESIQEDQVEMDIKQELRNLRRSENRITIQQEQINQAKGQLELARVKFHWGLADNFDVIEAESELRRSEINLLSVVLDYIVGSFRIRAAMGTLLEKPEGV